MPLHKKKPNFGKEELDEHEEEDDKKDSKLMHMDGGGVVKPVSMTLPPKTASDLSKGMNGGINWADGGEVGEPDSADSEIHDMMGSELMDAIHSKDHKRIMSGLEAAVLSCMNKNKG